MAVLIAFDRRMDRRARRTRTYPIYEISPGDLTVDDDDESIIEIRPIRRQKRSRKKPVRVRQQVSIDPYVVYGNDYESSQNIILQVLIQIYIISLMF